jgi:hypothetical protein
MHLLPNTSNTLTRQLLPSTRRISPARLNLRQLCIGLATTILSVVGRARETSCPNAVFLHRGEAFSMNRSCGPALVILEPHFQPLSPCFT